PGLGSYLDDNRNIAATLGALDLLGIVRSESVNRRVRLEQLKPNNLVVEIRKRTYVGNVFVPCQSARKELLRDCSREAAHFTNGRGVPGILRPFIVRVEVGRNAALTTDLLRLHSYP